MKADISLDLRDPELVGRTVTPSLGNTDGNSFETEIDEEEFRIEIEASGSGALRGCMDAAMRLSKLGEKIAER